MYKFTFINQKQNCFQSKKGTQTRIIIFRNHETIRKQKRDVDQDKDGEDVPILESAEVALVHWNLVNNNYQQSSKLLFTVVPNKQFGQWINIAPHSLIMLSTTNIGFSSIEFWFTDLNSKPLEMEDNVNMTLIIRYTL